MKNIIVTGCLGGIGAAVVRILLKNGYGVTGMDVADATAAGSTITEEVPEDALAIGRVKQSVKEGWAKRRRDERKK